MSFEQIPVLYLRGSLMNVTAKNLTKEQLEEVENTINIVWNDPDLQGHKYAFCEALRTTIKGDYLNHECAEQEARVAIWRACVSVLYHDQNIKPNDKVKIISDPIQRGKYFKTWLFNYLRQILRENKIPAIKSMPVEVGPASQVATLAVKSLIEFKGEDVEMVPIKNGYKLININQNMWPLSLSFDVIKLLQKYEQYGVIIKNESNSIEISGSDDQQYIAGRLVKSVRVSEQSLDNNSNDESGDSLRYTLEHKISQSMDRKQITVESEELKMLRDRIPDNILPIFEIILNTPPEFVEKFGNKEPGKNQIAKFLNRSPKEIDDAFKILRAHSTAVGLVK